MPKTARIRALTSVKPLTFQEVAFGDLVQDPAGCQWRVMMKLSLVAGQSFAVGGEVMSSTIVETHLVRLKAVHPTMRHQELTGAQFNEGQFRRVGRAG